MSKVRISMREGKLAITATYLPTYNPFRGLLGRSEASDPDRAGTITRMERAVVINPTHTLPRSSIGVEVEQVEIGKPEKEITIEPLEQPKETPAPEREPAPVTTPEKEPVGV